MSVCDLLLLLVILAGCVGTTMAATSDKKKITYDISYAALSITVEPPSSDAMRAPKAAINDIFKPKAAPAIKDIFKPKAAPAIKDIFKPKAAPAINDIFKPKAAPAINDIFKPKAAPAINDIFKPKAAPAINDIFKPKAAPAINDIFKPKAAPAINDIFKPKAAPAINDIFGSFSLEQPAMAVLAGVDGRPRRTYLQLLANLANMTGHRSAITLRIGGNSQDHTCYQYPDPTPGCTSNLTLQDLRFYSAFAAEARARFGLSVSFVLGTNLGGVKDPGLEATQIRDMVRLGMFNGTVAAVEIGNEVDSYISTHPHAGLDLPEQYAAEFEKYLQAYRAQGLPDASTQGGVLATALRPGWDAFLPSYIRRFRKALGSLSVHNYPTSTCKFGRKKAPTVTTKQLMSRLSSEGQARLYEPLIQDAAKQSLPMVIGEANSASCGGQANVSDTFASAAWCVDYLSEFARRGVARVNFHGNGSPYAPYSFRRDQSGFEVRPLYYGLLFFSAFTRGDVSWLPTQLEYTAGFPTEPCSVAHAVMAGSSSGADATDNRVLRVAVIMKEVEAAAGSVPTNITVTVPGSLACAATHASLHRLQPTDGRGLHAKNEIRFRGQTFDGSIDGRPVGRRSPGEVLTARQTVNGGMILRFIGQPASVNLLSIKCKAAVMY